MTVQPQFPQVPAPLRTAVFSPRIQRRRLRWSRTLRISHDDLLDRQVQSAVRYIPWTLLANSVSVLMLTIYAIPAETGSFRVWWPLANGVVGGIALAIWLPQRWQPRQGKALDVTIMSAVVFMLGSLNGLVAWRVLPVAQDGQVVLLCSTIAGAMGVGTIALSIIRPASFVWIGANSLSVSIAMLAQGTHQFDVLEVQLLLYTAVLVAGVLSHSRSFEDRCVAELEAENGRHLVGLLLGDFEDGSRDWMWETDEDRRLSHISERFMAAASLGPAELRTLTFPELLARSGAEASPAVPQRWRPSRRRWPEARRFEMSPSSCRSTVSDGSGPCRASRAAVTTGRVGAASAPMSPRRPSNASRSSNSSMPIRSPVSPIVGAVWRRWTNSWASGPTGPPWRSACSSDNFKSINDTLGHPVGDRVLHALANRFRETLRSNETCGRVGGDEFVITILGQADGTSPADRVEEILERLREPFIFGGHRLELRASAGIATAPSDADEPDPLMVAADLALYAAKAEGRDRARIYTADLETKSRARATALHDIRRGIAEGQFALYFQPQIALTSNTVTGFEALVRWHHPVHGLVGPIDFIPVAEEAGLIIPLGRWIFEAACRAAMAWPDHLSVAINVSPVQLGSDGLIDDIARILDDVGFDPHRVVMEVTESGLLDERSIAVLHQFRALGMKIALDDFGTGYASLATLRTLPIDRLKVNRSILPLPGEETDRRGIELIASVLAMADALEIGTVAEGVETLVQRDMLAALGGHAIQGYLEARPMPEDDIEDYLAERGNERLLT